MWAHFVIGLEGDRNLVENCSVFGASVPSRTDLAKMQAQLKEHFLKFGQTLRTGCPAGIPLSIQSGSNQFRIVSRCMQLFNYVCIFMVIPTNVQYTVESCWKHLPTSSFVSSLELHVAKSCNQGRVRSCRVMCPRAFPGQCATKCFFQD